MSNGGPNGFNSGDIAAITKLHADAAEAIKLRAENEWLRSLIQSMTRECVEHRNDEEAGWLACRLLAMAAKALEVPRG